MSDLGKVKLQRIVCGERDHESSRQVLWQRVAVVAEEQAIIAKRRHGDANLSQIIQVLQHRSLEEKQGHHVVTCPKRILKKKSNHKRIEKALMF